MRITTVLFDLDGTLIDTFALIMEAFRRACQAVLGSDPSNDDLYVHWGAPLRTRFAAIAPHQVDKLVAAYTPIYDALQMQLRHRSLKSRKCLRD
jgi:pyrophosphatase PpaX